MMATQTEVEALMRNQRRLRWIGITGLLLYLSVSPNQSLGATPTMTYENPIAYIGIDGNVYVTSLGSMTSTALTNDGYITDHDHHYFSAELRYCGLHWSPAGTQFSFKCTVAHNLYLARAGKRAVPAPCPVP